MGANTVHPTPPIDYPKVKIGGVSYSLKHSFGTSFRMEKMGFNIAQLPQYLRSEVDKGRVLQTTMKMLAAYVSPEFGHVALEDLPEYLSDLVQDGEFETYTTAVLEAMGKAPPNRKTTQPEPANPQPN